MINPILQTSIPTVEASKATTSGLRVDFGNGKNTHYILKIGNNNAVSGEMHDIAKLLVEHMDIVEDSRKQIKQGNTVTWDEFKKNRKKDRK